MSRDTQSPYVILCCFALASACSRGTATDSPAMAPAAPPTAAPPPAAPSPTSPQAAVPAALPAAPGAPRTFTELAPDAAFRLSSASVNVGGTAQTHYYHFKAPTGYNANKSASFPLIVYLHASGASNNPSELKDDSPYAPWWIRDLTKDKAHPSFVYVPVCPPPYTAAAEISAPKGGEWNSPAAKDMVVATIRNLSERFNVDRRRIHLVGFSMGGAGSYYIAHAFHKETKSRFASVNRGVGWSPALDKTEIHAALALSPVWIHVGGTEGTSVTLAQDSYAYLKGVRVGQGGTETTAVRSAGQGLLPTPEPANLVADTSTVTVGGDPVARLSIYRNRGHEDGLMFQNSDIFEWIFSHALPDGEVF